MPKDGDSPPTGYEPWIESYAFEDLLPLPIETSLTPSGWTIPKRVFDAYCMRIEKPEVSVNEHIDMLNRKQLQDDEDRRLRLEAAAEANEDTHATSRAARPAPTDERRHGLRRSTRRATKRTAATAAIHAYQVTRPPRSELEYFRAISYINSMVGCDSRAGACGGGLALGMTEFAYPLVSRSGLEPPAGLREETP